ncbi:hypothetical protein RN001_012280 [Aquatica leii]|uniref:Transposase n=1 Tax=Aquatica leii TaxID=1421715 RepID=A0AAN7P5A8_9COLE|nr:hypothetical protein RN001_012280 [Aquatica leii]
MLVKEEFLTIIPLKGKTRGKDIYDFFFNFVKNYKLPIYKLVCITTDGAPAMTGNKNVLHTDVWWLSRGKFLERFQELLPEITAFLDERGDDTQMLKNKKWLTDLAFLTDITMHLNTINLELQGKGKTIIEMISAVNAFKSKLQLIIDQLKRKDLKHFPSLKARIPQLNYDTYEAELSNILFM